MPTASSNVRVQEQSGKHMLVLSSSQFDPERKSRLFSGVICLLIVNPCLMDCTERAILTARTLEGGTGREGTDFFIALLIRPLPRSASLARRRDRRKAARRSNAHQIIPREMSSRTWANRKRTLPLSFRP